MTTLWAGAGRAIITPPVGIAHGGWGAQTHERAEGVEADLVATALVVADEDGLRVAIVELDLCLLMDDQCDDIRSAIAGLTGIPRQQVRVSFSHTHAAPVTNRLTGGWIRAGRELVGPYLAALPGLVAGAVDQAQRALRPCHVGAGVGESRIGVNRRITLGNGQVAAGHNWDGPVDPTVSVLRIDADDGQVIATLVHYSCHPTTAGPGNRLLSADYPGVTRRVVEAALGGRCLFLQGSAGDVGPIGGFSADLRIHQRLGAILGHAAVNIALQVNTRPMREVPLGVKESGHSLLEYRLDRREPEDLSLAVETRLLDLPLRTTEPREQLEREASRREDAMYAARERAPESAEVGAATATAKRAAMAAERARTLATAAERRFEVQAFRIGPVGLVGVPLEPFSNIGKRIRSASPFPVTMFSGYSNGYRYYLPTPDEVPRGGYEVAIALYGDDAVERLESNALDLLRSLAQREPTPRPPQGPPWSYGTALDHDQDQPRTIGS